MWAAALGGGALVLATMVCLVLMMTGPDRHLVLEDRLADAAGPTLVELLAREQIQRKGSGAFEEFDSDGTEVRIGPDRIALHDPQHHYSARVFGTALTLVARGNLDGDESIDDWQISSADPVPLHVYDDVRDLWIDSVLTEVYGLPMRGVNPDLNLSDRARLRGAMRAFKQSRQAKVVLEDLGYSELRYRREKKEWLLFDALTPDVWRALGDTTSGTLSHVVRATASGTSLLLTAIGDVDGDPCLDVWASKPGNVVAEHLQDDVTLDECPNGIGTH